MAIVVAVNLVFGLTSSSAGFAASRCVRDYPFNATYKRVVTVFARRHLTCAQAAGIGENVTVRYVHNRIPLASYAPPPRGVPGGHDKPFKISTRLGTFTCKMSARGSDFIDASCSQGQRYVRFDGNTHQIR